MKIVKATYLISSPSFDQCPSLKAAEYAFIGRSNVGKSSIINALCGQKNLPEALATRQDICRACPEWDATALNSTGRCRKCGCSTWAKLRMATEKCPIGKWEAVDKTPE